MNENNFPEKLSEVKFFTNKEGIIIGGYLSIYNLEEATSEENGIEEKLNFKLPTLEKGILFSLDANGNYNFYERLPSDSRENWVKITPSELHNKINNFSIESRNYKRYNFKPEIYEVESFTFGDIPSVPAKNPKILDSRREMLDFIKNSNLELAKYLIEKGKQELEEKKKINPNNIIPYQPKERVIVREGWGK
ncbi:MAG: hypothetical protein SFT90_04920 [Rickettsiales bacterium]|nr:hypothetical protein [Rickettsiales bacterium]